jgi:predicted N-acyltransferase
MLTVRLYDRIAGVDPRRWDALAREPLSEHGVLAALEAAGMAGATFRYGVVLDEGGRWIAGAPMATLPVDGAQLTHGLFRAWIGAVRSAAPSFLRTRIALCGAPLSVGTPPVRMAADAPAGRIYGALAPVLRDYARDCGAPWLAFKEFPAAALSAAGDALEPQGYLTAPSESGCLLPLGAGSYGEYLRALRSHYRYLIRRAERRFADSGGRVRAVSLASDYGPSHHALYDAVRGRAAVGLEWLTADFFTTGPRWSSSTPTAG